MDHHSTWSRYSIRGMLDRSYSIRGMLDRRISIRKRRSDRKKMNSVPYQRYLELYATTSEQIRLYTAMWKRDEQELRDLKMDKERELAELEFLEDIRRLEAIKDTIEQIDCLDDGETYVCSESEEFRHDTFSVESEDFRSGEFSGSSVDPGSVDSVGELDISYEDSLEDFCDSTRTQRLHQIRRQERLRQLSITSDEQRVKCNQLLDLMNFLRIRRNRGTSGLQEY